MSLSLLDLLLGAAVFLGGVMLAIVVIAFLRREVRPKFPSPVGELRPPGDRELKRARETFPPGDINPTQVVGCKWCNRKSVWRDMVTFACDVHRHKLYRDGKRAHRVTVALGDGVRGVGDDRIQPGKPIENGGKNDG